MDTKLSRRTLIKSIGLAATGSLSGSIYSLMASEPQDILNDDIYDFPMAGQVRLLHTTDIHAQLNPIYFREPNVNLGTSNSSNSLPHIVGTSLIDKLSIQPGTLEAYAYTCHEFQENARRFGKMGGLSNIKTLFDRFRSQAGGAANTLTLDGGDLWQGSATSLWTRGQDMVEASNILGIQLMTGHWEFTYSEEEVLSNLNLFAGEFLSQNLRIKEDSLFEDNYYDLVRRQNGIGLFDEDFGYPFKPFSIKEIAGEKIAVIGQAFPRTANANPPGFFPDWSFGIREDDLNTLVQNIKIQHEPAGIILLSHNGMDVDLKLASRVPDIDAILGGHTHDGIPLPVEVKSPNGKTCLVTNAGSNGKFIGVMDLDIKNNKVAGIKYQMAPVFDRLIVSDPAVDKFIKGLNNRVYDRQIVESRSSTYFYNQNRIGRSFDSILNEKLAKTSDLLYRRGNFMGSWDQLICNALEYEYASDVSLSPGFRWGTTLLAGEWITMRDVMNQCATTYGETYKQKMKGREIIQVLEQVADNLFESDPYLQSGGDMVRVGGLSYTISPKNKLGNRINDVKFLKTAQSLLPDESYDVSGWAVVGDFPSGRLIWDIVREYIIQTKNSDDVFSVGDINHPTISGMRGNFGIYQYQGRQI
jgi:sulfur-oxidizing protein SoxB